MGLRPSGLSRLTRVPFQDYDLAPPRGPFPSLANRFGLRRSQLLFHFGCCTLQTFTTETTGALASVICVDMGVVLSSRDGYVGEAVVDQQLAFLGVHVD